MLFLRSRGSTRSSNATWPTARMLPTCGGAMTTASWWLSVGAIPVSWSGPTSPRATGNSSSATVKSLTLRARMTEVRDELPLEVYIPLTRLSCRLPATPVPHQVTTVMWRGRTRSTTPSRPYPPTCDPWQVWSPTCSWKSPLWMKGEAMMLQMWKRRKITFWHFCLSLYKQNKTSCFKDKTFSCFSRHSLLLRLSCLHPFEITQPSLLFFFPLMAVHLSLPCFAL